MPKTHAVTRYYLCIVTSLDLTFRFHSYQSFIPWNAAKIDHCQIGNIVRRRSPSILAIILVSATPIREHRASDGGLMMLEDWCKTHSRWKPRTPSKILNRYFSPIPSERERAPVPFFFSFFSFVFPFFLLHFAPFLIAWGGCFIAGISHKSWDIFPPSINRVSISTTNGSFLGRKNLEEDLALNPQRLFCMSQLFSPNCQFG